MRDIIVFALVFGILPFCLIRPYIGVLAWSWIGYMNPHKLTWGSAYEFPFAQLIAAATLIGFMLLLFKKEKFPKFAWTYESILMILLAFFFTLTTIYALRPEESWSEWNHMAKVLLMTFITIFLINDERKMRYLFLVIAVSIGFFGFKGGIFTIVTGGGNMVLGPPGGVIEDNTAIGLALNMILPMLYFLAKSEPNKWLRRALYITFYLSIISVIFTYSRGALLGLVVVLSFIFLKLKFRHILLGSLVLALASPVIISVLPDAWLTKMETIDDFEKDGSAMSRIVAWKTAWNLAVDRPFLGGGFNAINDESVYDVYAPHDRVLTEVGGAHKTGVHSIYFEVLGENGFAAFAIFLLLMISCITSTRKIQKRFKGDKTTSLYYYASMVEIGIIGYAISGAFLELASFDLYYHLVALTIILKVVARKKLAEEDAPSATAPFAPDPLPLRTH